MARLRDVSSVLRKVGPLTLLRRVYREVLDDNLFTWAAAMAYAWLFAIFPFFLFLMTLVPYLRDEWKQQAEHQLAVALYQWLAKPAADTVWINIYPQLQAMLHDAKGGLLSIGLLLTVWAASGGMAMTMSALDRCYDVTNFRPFYRQRPLAVLLTLGVATLILAVMVLVPIGTVATSWLIKKAPTAVEAQLPLLIVWEITRYLLALLFMFGALSLVYHFGANHGHRYRFVTPGAVFSVAVWMLLGVIFRMYVARFGKYDQTYGTVGGVVILLLFFYFDSLVLLIGAEINSEIERDVVEMTGKEEPKAEELLAAAEAAKE